MAVSEDRDSILRESIGATLVEEESEGLWIPRDKIPDCNMQRESALFKKGITSFRQLFSARDLLALGRLRALILKRDDEVREWLLFAFSSTLRYTNRMVTRNPAWRGNRPLEWAKPGFWLPAVYLEVNVFEEFRRRCSAISSGKKDTQKGLIGNPDESRAIESILGSSSPSFYVETRSSTRMPLPNESIDAIITDPPYGSYVHYADLSNFWTVWLPREIEGMGTTIDDGEEAVIARKRFPKAKSPEDYQRLLEACFRECGRVLKPDGYMVMTFHNREPRAWAALLVAATRAGFELPEGGVFFQSGVENYRHTAQSRRAGSIFGDFVLSFKKPVNQARLKFTVPSVQGPSLQEEIVNSIREILADRGPLTPNELMTRLYTRIHGPLLRRVQSAVAQGEKETSSLISELSDIQLLDSHQRQLLEKHFLYSEGLWMNPELE
ncbi:MAG: DNA methyltransferase [Usitatibacter sp.]